MVISSLSGSSSSDSFLSGSGDSGSAHHALGHGLPKHASSSAALMPEAKSLIRQGFGLLSRGQYSGAIEKLDEAIAQDTQNPKAWLYRAQAAMQMRSFEAALKDFREVVRLNPTEARAWHGQGVAKAELRLYPSAVDSFDRAIACDPENDKIWYNKGRALLKLEQYDNAQESFERAIAINPDKYYAWYNLALAQAALDRVQPAIDSLQRVTELKPNCHYAWNYRGTLLNRLFQHDEALESFWESIRHRVPNPNAWYGLAASYALQQNPDAAAIHLAQAVQLNPSIYSLMARNDVSFDTVRSHPKIHAILRD
ncbi:MAG: tetratricopeptide repeat protein [Cyanobacteria bacterium J06614_10]